MPSPGLQRPCTRRSSPESRLLTTRTTEWLKRRGGNTPDQLDTSTRSQSRSEKGGPEKATPHPHASDKAELGGGNPGWEEREEDHRDARGLGGWGFYPCRWMEQKPVLPGGGMLLRAHRPQAARAPSEVRAAGGQEGLNSTLGKSHDYQFTVDQILPHGV